jgi:hypothetical protein
MAVRGGNRNGDRLRTLFILPILVIALSDGTAKWGISMILLWSIDIWAVPLYALFGWDWSVPRFYLLSLLDGGFLYFLLRYLSAHLFFKWKYNPSSSDARL